MKEFVSRTVIQNYNLNKKDYRGQSLVELLLAMGLAALFLPALITGFVSSREGRVQQNLRLEASNLLKEAEEAVRSVRERGWAYIAENGTFYPEKQAGSWNLVSGTQTINNLTRSIVVRDVFRDSSGAIVESGGTLDPSSKRARLTISWSSPFSSQVSQEAVLTRFLDNATFVSTTVDDFNAGTLSLTVVTNTSGGEVILGTGGSSDWCAPNLTTTTADLPKQGTARAIWAVPGHVSAGTGENASGVSYTSVSISNDNPPEAEINGTFDGYKTNDIWTDGSYVYIATDNNAKEVVILDVRSAPFTEIGWFNAPSPEDADGVYVEGNRGYVIAGREFYIFDLSEKTGLRPQLGNSFTLGGVGTSVVVKGSFAFVSVAASPEMQILDVSDPTNITSVGFADVDGSEGKRVVVNDPATRAYLVVGISGTQREFFILDVESKIGSRPIVGSYETNGMDPKSLSVVTGNKAIIVGSGAEEYQVIDITDETNPTRCGGTNVDSGINGISGVREPDGQSFAYIITRDASSELKVIEGGPGGSFSLTGIYESPTLAYPSADTPQQIVLNRFDANIVRPSQTDITIQVAATPAVSGSCSGATFSFVGPDGGSSSFYTSTNGTTIGGVIPISSTGSFRNPAYCFRYKVYFSSTDASATPVLYDITTNYSL